MIKYNSRFDVVYNNATLNIPTPIFDANSVIVKKRQQCIEHRRTLSGDEECGNLQSAWKIGL